MKRIMLFGVAAAALFTTSCIPQPEACVNLSSETLAVDEELTYTDCSVEALTYSVDFGDGNNSTEATGTHAYAEEGTYTFTFTGLSKKEKKTDNVTVSIAVTRTEGQKLSGTNATNNELKWNLVNSGFKSYYKGQSDIILAQNEDTYTDGEYMTFKANGTYEGNDGGIYTGTWELSADGTQLTIDEGTTDEFTGTIDVLTDTDLRIVQIEETNISGLVLVSEVYINLSR